MIETNVVNNCVKVHMVLIGITGDFCTVDCPERVSAKYQNGLGLVRI